tara:strand:+ start:2341 stop:2889 length:549 start_codon:yes stop_codon:yes gene_type:complete
MKNEIIKKDKGGEIVFFDAKAFAEKYEPVNVLKELRHIKTIDQAIQDDKNGISVYSKKIGEDGMLAIIELHLVALSESVNVGQPLTKYQIKEIAIEILSIFYYLSMTEICFVLRKAKRGEFGQLYGVLNIVAILDWFNQYSEERAQRFIQKSTKDIQNDFSQRSEQRKEWADHEKRKNAPND